MLQSIFSTSSFFFNLIYYSIEYYCIVKNLCHLPVSHTLTDRGLTRRVFLVFMNIDSFYRYVKDSCRSVAPAPKNMDGRSGSSGFLRFLKKTCASFGLTYLIITLNLRLHENEEVCRHAHSNCTRSRKVYAKAEKQFFH